MYYDHTDPATLHSLLSKKTLLAKQFYRLLSHQKLALIKRQQHLIDRIILLIGKIHKSLSQVIEQQTYYLKQVGYGDKKSAVFSYLETLTNKNTANKMNALQNEYQLVMLKNKRLCHTNSRLLDKQVELCNQFLNALSYTPVQPCHYNKQGQKVPKVRYSSIKKSV